MISSKLPRTQEDRAIFFDEKAWLNRWDRLTEEGKKLRRCKRCLYGEDIPSIKFDERGVCNYCAMHDKLAAEYQTGSPAAERRFAEIVSKIRQEGKGKPYDLVVGVSGGADSSYLIHLAKERWLRPLAVHFDNTWNSSIAVENIHNVLKKHDVELNTYVVDNEEYDEIYRAFLRSGTIDLEIPTDLGLATVLNRVAEEVGTRFIFEGHSFQSEGLFPIGWLYMDARYLESVVKRHGNVKLDTYPSLWLKDQLRWMLMRRITKVRPLWYLKYDKPAVKEMLQRDYGWKWYGGHHLENRMASFFHTYFAPRRWAIDARIVGRSAHVRSGLIGREEAAKEIEPPPDCSMDQVFMLMKRWGFDQTQFEDLMTLPFHTYREYDNYKPIFEKYRPFFYLLAKAELIPMSFYVKYTSKDNI